VDRPQGLLLVYRLVAATAWNPTVRLIAIVAATVAALGVGVAAWALIGRRAAVIAAVLFAVLSPAPHLEGFTANGELLATAFTTCAVAAAAVWWSRGRQDRRLVFIAGVLAAIGPLMKQSAVDGLLAVFALVLVSGLFGQPGARWQLRRLLGDLVAFGLGALLPLGLAVLHATTIGLGDWWFTMVGHRAQTDSLIHGQFAERVELFKLSLGPFWRDLGVLVPLFPAGLVVAGFARRLTLPLVWLLAAAAGFAVGGLYHTHYWIQLAAPLCLLAAFTLDWVAARVPALALGLGALALAVPVAYALPIYGASTNAKASLLSSKDRRLIGSAVVGDYVQTISKPDDEMAVLWTDAALYWEADRAPAFRYMWLAPLTEIHGGLAAARASITGPHPPAIVVVVTNVAQYDDGSVGRALATRYDLLRSMDNMIVYRLRGAT